MSKYSKRFSIAHFDRFHGEHEEFFYTIMKNSSPSFLDNIHDVYFGKYFHYKYEGQDKKCGNPMGVEATDSQVDYLFKFQEETGVEISLTFNTVEVPHEVVFNHDIRSQFVEWIGSYYDRGLRSCTISSEHIMRTGELQARCPDMRWKSTVNQICADAQQLIDYAYLGYNTVLLDRSLNRNIKELRRVREAQNYLNSKNPKKKLLTSLLIAESCIYRCPFKKEHDSVGEHISTDYFKGPADLSCNGWRGLPEFAQLPRSGIDLVANSEMFEKFAGLVDIFKYSGRLTVPMVDPKEAQYFKAAWFYKGDSRFKQTIKFANETVYTDDFTNIITDKLDPVHDWVPGFIDTRNVKNDYKTTWKGYNGIWSTEEGKRLEKLLASCRNQCWDCHECERTFGFQDVDSALQLRKVNRE
jgi:hypothetical protein